MQVVTLLFVIFASLMFFMITGLLNANTEMFAAPGSLAAAAGASSDNCSVHCDMKDPQTGLPADPYDCCECRTTNGVLQGIKDSENEPFRKCMCSYGAGYESYCYKLSTNFLLSQ